MASKSFIFRFADVEVREREFSLIKAGERLPVEPKAFRVLLILLRNPGKLIPKQELLDAVWGDAAVTENSLARAVALLRKVLGDEARTPKFIETVATVGYRFLGTVEAVEDPTAASTLPEAAADGDMAGEVSTAQQREATAKRWKSLAPYVVAAVVILGGGYWYLSRPLPAPRITAYTQLTHDGKNKSVATTDGSRLYINFESPNFIAQIGVKGGEFAKLPIAIPGSYMEITDVSPDGSTALISDFEADRHSVTTWIAPVLGGAARRLDDGNFAAFSPDGGSVIYSTFGGEIFTIGIDGTGKRQLAKVTPTPPGRLAGSFSWSPDGKVIRFAAENPWLCEMRADGSGMHRLIPNWNEGGYQCCGRWTRDGSFYLFVAGDQLWALDERRRLLGRPSPVPIQLTNGTTRWSTPVPGWDGKTIFVEGINPRGELSRIDVKTGSLQPFLSGISAQDVWFSPDGRLVAWVAFPEGTLWRADRDGNHRVQLTQPTNWASNPRWSPDSKEIVFGTQSTSGHMSIHRISAEDGTPLWLISDDSVEMHDPNWSPDGTRVLYGRGVPSSLSMTQQDLRIVDLRTRQTTMVPGSEGMWSPRWSTDGRYIAAFFNGPGSTQLPILDMTTRQWHFIPVNGEMDYVSFSHDSRFIYFLRHGRDQGVFRVPVAEGKEDRVVDLTDWHLTGNFGFSLSLDPTDAPLILRDMSSNDIFALTFEQ